MDLSSKTYYLEFVRFATMNKFKKPFIVYDRYMLLIQVNTIVLDNTAIKCLLEIKKYHLNKNYQCVLCN